MRWTRKTSKNIKPIVRAVKLRPMPLALNFFTYDYFLFKVDKINAYGLPFINNNTVI